MSTRSNIIILGNEAWGVEVFQLYRHWDGYPEGVLTDLPKALDYAWKLPRFEASDFGAAIIRAWKENGGGNVYLDPTPPKSNMFKHVHGDVEWVYIIYQKDFELMVDIYDWYKSKTKSWKTIKFSDCTKVAKQINKKGR